LFFDQSLSWQVILGLILIIAGVVLVNTFSDSHGVE
jgi:multidrug transporter EmrE-like cation transporter